jgi:hypothetical protein
MWCLTIQGCSEVVWSHLLMDFWLLGLQGLLSDKIQLQLDKLFCQPNLEVKKRIVLPRDPKLRLVCKNFMCSHLPTGHDCFCQKYREHQSKLKQVCDSIHRRSIQVPNQGAPPAPIEAAFLSDLSCQDQAVLSRSYPKYRVDNYRVQSRQNDSIHKQHDETWLQLLLLEC